MSVMLNFGRAGVSFVQWLSALSHNWCENLSPFIVRIEQEGNPHVPVLPLIASAQMGAYPALCRLHIRVAAVMQHHQLHITEESFHRVVIGTSLGHRNPMQLEFPHRPACSARF